MPIPSLVRARLLDHRVPEVLYLERHARRGVSSFDAWIFTAMNVSAS